MCNGSDPEAKMVSIDIEVEDSLLFKLMKRAHEADVTFNRYVQALIEDYLDEIDREGTGG